MPKPYPPGKGVDNFDTCVKYLDDPLTITFKDSTSDGYRNLYS